MQSDFLEPIREVRIQAEQVILCACVLRLLPIAELFVSNSRGDTYDDVEAVVGKDNVFAQVSDRHNQSLWLSHMAVMVMVGSADTAPRFRRH